MRWRTFTGIALSAVLVLSQVQPALGAATGSISPGYQTQAYGVASNWSTSWGQISPFDQYFCYGDGSPCPERLNTTSRSRSYSRTFYPCVRTSYRQTLYVKERATGSIDYTNSTAVESGGTIC